MYNQSRELTFFLFASVAIATALTGLVVWEQVFLITDDSWVDTLRAISREIGGPVPTAILVMGNLEVIMVISRYIIEQYRKERYDEAVAKGEAQGVVQGRVEGAKATDKKWRGWYNRMLEARARGEEFNEPPPEPHPAED